MNTRKPNYYTEKFPRGKKDLGEQISTNFKRGNAITRLEDISNEASKKKCLYHHSWGMKPAAWFYHLSLALLNNLITNRQLFKTEKI